MRRTWCVSAVCVLGLVSTFGCDALIGLISSTTVTVSLVNTTGYPIDVSLFYDDQQDAPAFLLTEVGTQLELTVPAGDTVVFSRNCDELQAIVIDDADLRVLGNLGPETNSDVLRDGDDFSCGGAIEFTFTGNELTLDVDVQAS